MDLMLLFEKRGQSDMKLSAVSSIRNYKVRLIQISCITSGRGEFRMKNEKCSVWHNKGNHHFCLIVCNMPSEKEHLNIPRPSSDSLHLRMLAVQKRLGEKGISVVGAKL